MKCDIPQVIPVTINVYPLIFQLSYSSASPALSDKTKYKRFFRVFPPESSFNPAKFALLKEFNWERVGTLHEAQEIFSLVMSTSAIFNWLIIKQINSSFNVSLKNLKVRDRGTFKYIWLNIAFSVVSGGQKYIHGFSLVCCSS